jgi:hypothetical protein
MRTIASSAACLDVIPSAATRWTAIAERALRRPIRGLRASAQVALCLQPEHPSPVTYAIWGNVGLALQLHFLLQM